MKRAFKWLGIALAGLAGLIVLAMVVVYAVSARRISKVYIQRPTARHSDRFGVDRERTALRAGNREVRQLPR